MRGVASPLLIVFDCDGVLVDSERLMQAIDMRMIGALGWRITQSEMFDHFLGRSEAVGTANIERKLGRPVPESFVDDRRAAHAAAFATSLEPVPGICEAVTSVQADGYATCVASSGSHARIRLMLDRTSLRVLFDDTWIFSGDDVHVGKPAPDLFLHAAETMGYQPDRCVVVEDSPSGVTAAHAAGMPVIGYCALTPARALADADALVSDMSDLNGAIHELTSTTSGPASAAGSAGVDDASRFDQQQYSPAWDPTIPTGSTTYGDAAHVLRSAREQVGRRRS